ncbi:MAG: family 43 glycosylhydrolase [Bacteroidales bacterium]|nr:family 43 glycosylhydrolase [Bacteroidales bacterium]
MKKTNRLLVTLIFIGCVIPVFADYPLVSHRYLADPASLVYNGRVYLYCSNDDENPGTEEGGYQMASLVCISSSDLKNWTDHGVVFRVPRDAAWASRSWAPSIVERNGTFYLYFGNGGSNIGVVTANNPLGPFTDPVGGNIVNINTPGVLPAENMWVFDPMTFVDDGQAYMYFGGNGEDNMRVIRLNEDMISLAGAATQFHVPYFFEASWMHKYKGTYYFSYSTNPANGMRIDYMTSDNPTTGFTYGGIVSPQPPENNNNNHQAIFEFKGIWFQAYHNRYVARKAGIPPVYKRNLCLDSFYHRPDGSIITMVNTPDGLPQLGYINPYERMEAETMDDQHGIYTDVCNQGGMHLMNLENGDWTKVRGVDFGANGAAAFTASVACEMKYGVTRGGSIEVHLDATDGTLVGSVPVPYTGGYNVWKTETIAVDGVTGVHDVYFVYRGEADENLFCFDYWTFTEKTGTRDLLGVNVSVDDYKIDTVPGYDSTTIRVTAVYSDGTGEDVTASASFGSDPENIISITGSMVKGLAYDTVRVTASFNGGKDSVLLVVKDLEGELTVVQLNAGNSDIRLYAGSTTPVIVTATFGDGHVEDVTSKASYVNPNPEIATIANGIITGVSEGEVDITVRYGGALGDEKSTVIHVAVTAGSGIWLEAECGTVGTLWNVVPDNNASHGAYVTVKPGNNSTDGAPTNASGHLTLTFDVQIAGTYTVYTRVICPNANDDSFWLRMDDGSFTMWNGITGSSAWIWTYFPTTYNLTAGSHTLTIAYREDGARLDKIWITNAGKDLTGPGSEAVNCPVNSALLREIPFEVKIYPNPSKGAINIEGGESFHAIEVFNIDGKLVCKKSFNGIEKIGLEKGMYIARLTGNALTLNRKIIME